MRFAVEDASQLVSLQKRPPASINGLRYRMASDVPEILRVLRAFSYYDATLTTDLEVTEKEPYQVYVFIQSGPPFKLASYTPKVGASFTRNASYWPLATSCRLALTKSTTSIQNGPTVWPADGTSIRSTPSRWARFTAAC